MKPAGGKILVRGGRKYHWIGKEPKIMAAARVSETLPEVVYQHNING
jgi:hypothetical protein